MRIKLEITWNEPFNIPKQISPVCAETIEDEAIHPQGRQRQTFSMLWPSGRPAKGWRWLSAATAWDGGAMRFAMRVAWPGQGLAPEMASDLLDDSETVAFYQFQSMKHMRLQHCIACWKNTQLWHLVGKNVVASEWTWAWYRTFSTKVPKLWRYQLYQLQYLPALDKTIRSFHSNETTCHTDDHVGQTWGWLAAFKPVWSQPAGHEDPVTWVFRQPQKITSPNLKKTLKRSKKTKTWRNTFQWEQIWVPV